MRRAGKRVPCQLAAKLNSNDRSDSDRMSGTTDSHRLLWTGFLRFCEQFPTRGAIEVAGREVELLKEDLAPPYKSSLSPFDGSAVEQFTAYFHSSIDRGGPRQCIETPH